MSSGRRSCWPAMPATTCSGRGACLSGEDRAGYGLQDPRRTGNEAAQSTLLPYYLERRDPAFAAKRAEVLYVYQEVAILRGAESDVPKACPGRGPAATDKTEPDVAFVSYGEKPGIQEIANTAPDLPPIAGKHASIARETMNTSVWRWRRATIARSVASYQCGRCTSLVSLPLTNTPRVLPPDAAATRCDRVPPSGVGALLLGGLDRRVRLRLLAG